MSFSQKLLACAGEPPDPLASPVDVQLDMDIRTGLASLVKRQDDPEWVPINSSEGRAILDEAHRRCGADKTPQPCLPAN